MISQPTGNIHLPASAYNAPFSVPACFQGPAPGTAKNLWTPFLESHRADEKNDAPIYCEAFTLGSAQAIRDYLVSECGLRLGLEDAPEPGRLVFACKVAPVATP